MMRTAGNYFSEYYRVWTQVAVPLRPDPDVVAAFRGEIGMQQNRTLLLGVTPELADVSSSLVAVDRNLSMVRHVWPGNDATRSAIVGDWQNSNFVESCFDRCVGDGSLNIVRFADGTVRVCAEMRRILRPGGRLICRLYVARADDRVGTVAGAAAAGRIRGFHAFKLLLGMAIATETGDPNVPVRSIFDRFTDLFPDRDDLVRRTGWERSQIDTIDFYRDSATALVFPTEVQWRRAISDVFPDMRLVPCGTYELAERCPLLVATRP
jgi:SAM-dependent methyltransferase